MTKLNIDTNRPITLVHMSNGGYTVEQPNFTPPFEKPDGGRTIVAAFTNASDMLLALNEVINPTPNATESEPESSVTTDTPPFDILNEHDEWLPMHTAPRNGIYVRIEDEEGARHRPMKYTSPGWWDSPQGELRLADTVHLGEFNAGVVRAAKWRPLSPDEDDKYNGRKPIRIKAPKKPGVAPLPAPAAPWQQ